MSKTTLNLVVAACNSRGIGKNGQLPWRLRKDMDFFKKITMETKDEDKKNAVIMGRKTWFSIPEKFRPLAKRINIVLSREMKEAPPGVYIARGLDEAINMVNKDMEDKVESICIIGGSSVYKEALESDYNCRIFLTTILADFVTILQEALESDYNCRIFLTKILADFDCDTFLPEFDENLFKIVENYEGVPVGKQTEKDIDFVFEVYEKITSIQMTGFNVIAAMCSDNRGIGFENKLPWPRLEKDIKHYTEICEPKTEGKCTAIIKGRTTWEISSHAMKSNPKFKNIVISNTKRKQLQSNPYIYMAVQDLDEALTYGSKLVSDGVCESIWILGGQPVYEASVQHPCCEKIYLTEIYQDFKSDTFFPEIPNNLKESTGEEEGIDSSIQEEVGIQYQFKVYTRIKQITEDKMCGFSIMAAMCSNRGIGLNNALPWPYIEKDFQHYMKVCSPRTKDKYSVIIYGRKTFESLSDTERTHDGFLKVVISKTKLKYLANNTDVHKVFENISDALVCGKEMEEEGKCDRVWVLGGQQIYETAINHPRCKRIYLTEIYKDFKSDSFFPEIPQHFKQILGEEDGINPNVQEDNGIQFRFTVYERMSV